MKKQSVLPLPRSSRPEGPVLEMAIKTISVDEPHPVLKELLIKTAESFYIVGKARIEYGRNYEGGDTMWWVCIDRPILSSRAGEDLTNMLEGVISGWNAAMAVKTKK
jgi:hypothetical protein